MSYDEQRISDQIDGGLYQQNQQEMTQTKEQTLTQFKLDIAQDMWFFKFSDNVNENKVSDVLNKIEEFLNQELSKEREKWVEEKKQILEAIARGEKLSEELRIDGPSLLELEREKTKKLVDLLEECLEYHLDETGDRFIIERIKQSLNEIAEQPQQIENWPLKERDWPCPNETCLGEMIAKGYTQPNGITQFECTECGKTESYP